MRAPNARRTNGRDFKSATPHGGNFFLSSPGQAPRLTLRRQIRQGAHRMITISVFKWVPEFAQGQVRYLRARWALEESGLPYKTRSNASEAGLTWRSGTPAVGVPHE